ncbi:helix-turn-helix domain-containing protein [Winogradskya humida]|uniref:Transcriptional regulator n=1 Tax=Winogradskya humida TaxID=113566 RepID=A0ABQ3ZRZ0_9ACTN|nr:helix-turn-helix transcriptional regulator [Actinoplanes humidus]GIE21328.1 transcriptional regulator [Actinoplanes humidus]
MPERKQAPTARLRRLAAELRQLRAASGLTRETIEEKTGVNTATLYRLESARARPQKRTLITLLNLYGVADKGDRARLLELTRDSGQLDWLQPYGPGLSVGYQSYINFESEADRLRNFECLYVPGLLQVEAYARAVIHGVLPALSDNEVEQRVRVRMQRQNALLRERRTELWVVMDEPAVRRSIGTAEVMREQLLFLGRAGESPNITIQVLPYSAGAHPGMQGSFMVMEFPNDDPALIYTETIGGGLILEAETDLIRHSGIYRHLVAQALSPAETLRFINAAAQAA